MNNISGPGLCLLLGLNE